MKHVLVTGSSGFIGSHLIEELNKQGLKIKCLVRKNSNMQTIHALGVDYVVGDLHHYETLKDAVTHVDTIFHLAGRTKCRSEEEFMESNYEGTLNLLKAVEAYNPDIKRFLFVSSLAAAGPGHDGQLVDELSDPRPVTVYGKSKLKAEEAVLSYQDKFPVTIIRPPSVYGPRDTDMYHSFLSVQRGVIPYLGKKDMYVSVIYVKDLVRGLILAADKQVSIGKIYFIAAEEKLRWKDFCLTIADLMDTKAYLIRVPFPIFLSVTLLNQVIMKLTHKMTILNYYKIPEFIEKYWICNGEKFRQELHFKPEFTLTRGLVKTIKWYRDQGWLKG